MSNEIKLTIMGTASALPSSKEFTTSVVCEMSGNLYVCDCGEGMQVQMRKSKIKIFKIKVILVSHMHGDHILGLVGFLCTMSLLGRKEELTIIGPKKLEKWINKSLEWMNSRLKFPINFIKTKKKTYHKNIFQDDKVYIDTFPLEHTASTHGFKICQLPKKHKLIAEKLEEYDVPFDQRPLLQNGKDITVRGIDYKNNLFTNLPNPSLSFAFVTDTIYQENTVEYIKNVDMLYHESTFLKKDKQKALSYGHSTSEQAGTTAHLAKAKKLVLGHFSSSIKNRAQVEQEAREVFDKDVVLASQGKVIYYKV